MQPEERDLAYLWDMLDAARTAMEFTNGVLFQQYAEDRKLQLAVEPFREAHPEIPWRKIVAQRHVLAHDYGDIQQERLWALVKEHLPSLVAQLDALVPSVPGDP
jgi:uncharacterized protein with HEPN domain